MATPLDLDPAGQTLLATVHSLTDDQLALPTPCEGRTVGQLVNHLSGLTLAFRAAADKELGELTTTNPDQGGWPDAPPRWREELNEQIPALTRAWRSADAWEGMTQVGGQDLPGDVAGLVALDELVLHGWDLARSVDAPFDLDEATATACLGFAEGFDAAGTPGLFWPALPVPDHAPTLDRLLARSGRDPHWTPPGAAQPSAGTR